MEKKSVPGFIFILLFLTLSLLTLFTTVKVCVDRVPFPRPFKPYMIPNKTYASKRSIHLYGGPKSAFK